MRSLLSVLMLTLCSSTVCAQADVAEPRPVIDPSVPIVEIQLTLVEWLDDGQPGAEAISGTSEQVANRIAKLEAAGKLRVSQRFRLTAIHERSTTTQRGERRPRANAASSSRGGPGGTSVVLESVGTLLEVTPTVQAPNTITLDVSYESSNLITRKDAIVVAESPEGDKVRVPSITTLILKTTLRVKDGETAVVVGAAEQDERVMLLIGAKTIK